MIEARGINSAVFNCIHPHGLTRGLNSNRELKINLSENSISIADSENHDLSFHAFLTNQRLIIGVQTRGYEGDPKRHHPDLFAADLVKAAIAYFTLHGQKITEWQAIWSPNEENASLSDNWNEFTNQLPQGKYLNFDVLARAARNTWTGRLAEKLNFSEIINISFIRGVECVVTFSKP